MNFKDDFLHWVPLFSSNNILKFGDEITLENILFVSSKVVRKLNLSASS